MAKIKNMAMTAMMTVMVILGTSMPPSYAAEGDRTITYYIVSPIPDIPDAQIPNDALEQAIQDWQRYNPGLSFEPGDINSDLKIEWEKFHYPEHTGYAYCDHPQNCIIEIGLGDTDCNGSYIQADANYATNTIMDLIGVTFELYNTDQDYRTPPSYDGYYVGQESVALQHDALEGQRDRLYMEYRKIQNEILTKFDSTHQTKDGDQTQSVRSFIDRINAKADEIRGVTEQMAPLSDKLNCYDDIEPVAETVLEGDSQKAKTVTYRTGPIPNIPDVQIPQSALARAIHNWQQSNPGLVFEREDADADIMVEWEILHTSEHVGRAYCIDPQNCVIEISLGGVDCNGDYIQSDMNYVTNTIMHEIGHALGLNHHRDRAHLMFGYDSVEDIFDSRGYQIPELYEGYFVGEAQAREEYIALDEQHAALDLRLAEIRDEYEDILEKTGLTNVMVQEAFQTDPRSMPRAIYMIADKYTQKAGEIKQVTEQMNTLANKLNCYYPEPEEASPEAQDVIRTVTYSVGPIPDISDMQIPQDALADAIQNWQELNSGLEFERNDTSPDIVIEWERSHAEDYNGIASCDSSGDCTIVIGLGGDDCNDRYMQADADYVSNTIMHEIGHALGLGHHRDQSHLMFGDDEFVELVFDPKGYQIPERHKGHFVGEGQTLEQIDAQEERYDRLILEYNEIKKEIEEALEPHGYTFESLQVFGQLVVSGSLAAEVNPIIDRLNEKVGEIRVVMGELDLLNEELRCYPDSARFYSSTPEVLRTLSDLSDRP